MLGDSIPMYSLFQSTLPRRERRRCQGHLLLLLYFNPRSREGSDSSTSVRSIRYCYFNPRSREGSDESRRRFRRSLLISIHAPAKGATSRGRRMASAQNYFNPRSREGSDRLQGALHEGLHHFNPRSREGSDRM